MLYVIINPTAGNGLAARVGKAVLEVLADRGIAHIAMETEYAGHATELARQAVEAGAQTVAAVGGDGTLLEIVRGINGSKVALGVIPAGTGNDVVKMLAIPQKPMEALDFLLSHPPRQLDAGKINDAMFLNVCGTGIDVVVLDYAEAAKRYVRGILPYFWGVIRALISYKPVNVKIAVDGGAVEEHKVLLTAIGNGRYIGGGMNVAPDAVPNDGLFDLLIIENMPKWKLPPHLPKLLNGKIREVPGVIYKKCRQVSLQGKNMRVNVDGEISQMNAAMLEIEPGALMAHW